MMAKQGQLQENQSLAAFTSWRVGGVAKQVYQPADRADLQQFLAQLPENEPLLWLGLGSNTLIRDGGFAGTVIITQPMLSEITLLTPTKIRAEAGVSCAKLARYAARKNLQGLEFLAGIPGTVGGALRMNAGCFNGETWSRVCAVELIDGHGQISREQPEAFTVAYRQVEGLEQRGFLAGEFQLTPGKKETSLAMIRDLLAHRAATQPTSEHSCGSVFRNPPNDFAARLIESCGLKGYRVGGACVSTKHANFILNEADATAADIEALIQAVQMRVFEEHGVKLTPEVHIIG